MPPQSIKLLHVEDNVADRLLTAKLLGGMKDYDFNIVRAATEITAVAELNKGGFQFVILDYKLPLGDGLGCLRKLRQIDAAVPIIVLSGVTTPEIGAECLKAGADDYLSKQELTGDKLAASVRKAMNRADSWSGLKSELLPLCQFFLTNTGPEFFKALDDVEKALRLAGCHPEQVSLLAESIAGELGQAFPNLPGPPLQFVRPLLLELSERLAARRVVVQAKSGSRPGV
jgi:CheY-like chemotaxis protein